METENRELREYQDRLEKIMRISSISWWEMDCATGTITFSENKARMLGYDPARFSHYSDFTGLLHPDDYEPVMEGMRRHLVGEKDLYNVTYRIRNRAGEYRRFRDIGGITARGRDGTPLKVVGVVFDITAVKEAGDLLVQSGEKYRTLFENSALGVFRSTPEGRFLEVNQALADMLGYGSPEEVLADIYDIAEQIYVSTGHREEIVEETIGAGAVTHYENVYRKKDGTLFHANLYLRVAKDGAGDPLYLEGIVEDITERKNAEHRLRESEERFRTLAWMAPAGIYLTDTEGKCVYVNERWSGMAGLSSLEARGDDWKDALHPDDRDRIFGAWQEMVSSQTGWFEEEYRFQDARGTVSWIYGVAARFYGDNGAPAGYIGVNLDITERKRTYDEALRLSHVLENSLNEIYIFDCETLRFIEVNRGARNNLGYDIGELRRLTPVDIKPEFTMERFEALIAPLRGGESESLTFQTVHRRKDGSLYPVEVHLQKMDIGDPVFVSIILDITDRVRAGEELERALHDKEELLRELQHRVKNSFINISSLIEMEADRALDEKTRTVLGDLSGRINSMGELYTMLHEIGTVNRVSLGEYCGQVVKSLSMSYAEINGTVAVSTELEDIDVSVDLAAPLGLILTELLTNAYKHAFPGRDGGTIRVTLRKKGDSAELSVADTGDGLPDGLDVHKSGSMGLELVRALTGQLTGSLAVISGNETVFSVTFPLKETQ